MGPLHSYSFRMGLEPSIRFDREGSGFLGHGKNATSTYLFCHAVDNVPLWHPHIGRSFWMAVLCFQNGVVDRQQATGRRLHAPRIWEDQLYSRIQSTPKRSYFVLLLVDVGWLLIIWCNNLGFMTMLQKLRIQRHFRSTSLHGMFWHVLALPVRQSLPKHLLTDLES